MARGFLLAAPASGSGKTLIALTLIALFRASGKRVRAAKAGPDYIDPAFHAAASGAPCFNLDPWAMTAEQQRALLAHQAQEADLVLVEGAMGLFDGIDAEGTGSAAVLARNLDLPIVLVMPARGQGATLGALLDGLIGFDPGLRFAGIIFNQVGGSAHREILASIAAARNLPVLGCLPRLSDLALPSRHLGLVQAGEYADLAERIAGIAKLCAEHLDSAAIWCAAGNIAAESALPLPALLPPLGQRLAVARDIAFAFLYESQLLAWRAAGAEILPFSPLADEAPDREADAVFLPGGYPELHAGRLAANGRFRVGLRQAAERGAVLYGECGGYMVLGRHLVDAQGERHEMAGLLPVETSFAAPRLALGYRRLVLQAAGPLGPAGAIFRGHEFHYSQAIDEAKTVGIEPLFAVADARGRDRGLEGQRLGKVMGSYHHLIACVPS